MIYLPATGDTKRIHLQADSPSTSCYIFKYRYICPDASCYSKEDFVPKEVNLSTYAVAYFFRPLSELTPLV